MTEPSRTQERNTSANGIDHLSVHIPEPPQDPSKKHRNNANADFLRTRYAALRIGGWQKSLRDTQECGLHKRSSSNRWERHDLRLPEA